MKKPAKKNDRFDDLTTLTLVALGALALLSPYTRMIGIIFLGTAGVLFVRSTTGSRMATIASAVVLFALFCALWYYMVFHAFHLHLTGINIGY
jgi:hypothetical protein